MQICLGTAGLSQWRQLHFLSSEGLRLEHVTWLQLLKGRQVHRGFGERPVLPEANLCTEVMPEGQVKQNRQGVGRSQRKSYHQYKLHLWINTLHRWKEASSINLPLLNLNSAEEKQKNKKTAYLHRRGFHSCPGRHLAVFECAQVIKCFDKKFSRKCLKKKKKKITIMGKFLFSKFEIPLTFLIPKVTVEHYFYS